MEEVTQLAIPAVFMRGGTSKGLMVHARDLPDDPDKWSALLCGAMGSPDQYGRQLNGMGGGISSLSKVCVIGPSSREDADIDYTFVQVMIKEARIDFRSNCGNMSSAVGPFAFDEGLVGAVNDTCVVRIHNTNTSKIIRSTFAVEDGRAVVDGDFIIPGVAASGSPVRLDFLEPGGASTGRLLPTGVTSELIDTPTHGPLEVSMVDAANAAVFVRAADVGLTGVELPSDLEANDEVLGLLEVLRREASVRMGIAPTAPTAAAVTSIPFVCLVSAAAPSTTLSGDHIASSDVDLVARVISNGQPHRAMPLTIALCTAVAARLAGSVVASSLASSSPTILRIAMPSGILEVDADVARVQDHWVANSGTFYRTARRLFEGRVWSHLK